MTLDSMWQVFAVGVFGGFLAELLHWRGLSTQKALPVYSRRLLYWVVTALLILSGGGVALLFFGSHADGLLTLHVGASTPLLLQKMVAAVPDRPGARTAGPSVKRFFRW